VWVHGVCTLGKGCVYGRIMCGDDDDVEEEEEEEKEEQAADASAGGEHAMVIYFHW
jgi:hypothetical protein